MRTGYPEGHKLMCVKYYQEHSDDRNYVIAKHLQVSVSALRKWCLKAGVHRNARKSSWSNWRGWGDIDPLFPNQTLVAIEKFTGIPTSVLSKRRKLLKIGQQYRKGDSYMVQTLENQNSMLLRGWRVVQ